MDLLITELLVQMRIMFNSQVVYAHAGEDNAGHHMMDGVSHGFWGGMGGWWILGAVILLVIIVGIVKK